MFEVSNCIVDGRRFSNTNAPSTAADSQILCCIDASICFIVLAWWISLYRRSTTQDFVVVGALALAVVTARHGHESWNTFLLVLATLLASGIYGDFHTCATETEEVCSFFFYQPPDFSQIIWLSAYQSMPRAKHGTIRMGLEYMQGCFQVIQHCATMIHHSVQIVQSMIRPRII